MIPPPDGWEGWVLPVVDGAARAAALARDLPDILASRPWFAVDADRGWADVPAPALLVVVADGDPAGPALAGRGARRLDRVPVLDPGLHPGGTLPPRYPALLVAATGIAAGVLGAVPTSAFAARPAERSPLRVSDPEVADAVRALVRVAVDEAGASALLTLTADWLERVAAGGPGGPAGAVPDPDDAAAARAVHALVSLCCGPDGSAGALRAEAAALRSMRR